MKNKITVLGASAILFVMPVIVGAQSSSDGIGSFITQVGTWVSSLLPIMLTLGVLAFFWGLAKYLFGGAEDHKAGIRIMTVGVLAVFIMASIGGIVAMLQRTTGTDQGGTLNPPCIGKDCGKRGGGLPPVINGQST